MRSIRRLLWLVPALFLLGCGPSDVEEAGESFSKFSREWIAKEFPVEPVLKETTVDVPVGDDTAFKTEKGYYRRQTMFQDSRIEVLPTDRSDAPFLGILHGERIVQSTSVHPTAEVAKKDASFTGARFVYPEKYEFEYSGGEWRLRE